MINATKEMVAHQFYDPWPFSQIKDLKPGQEVTFDGFSLEKKLLL